ncbi:hypothetical protein UY416_14310 [Paenibacillus polymyxa]|uniref:hypothetical protein n=1 Tax=Paenibacillus polymyxa TaxID=1406 RepID=UPI002AB56085|nr:hypothetical protein [Paenibacillus polymyxa]MDY8047460.1 hypothetical protein [Paenibacillus polymyxa]
MKINDEYLKEQLKHVYWLNGGCCAGKSTMIKKFVKELGFQTLEDNVMKYRPFTNPVEYPALQYPHSGLDWDKWFNKPNDEHVHWLFQIVEEMMERLKYKCFLWIQNFGNKLVWKLHQIKVFRRIPYRIPPSSQGSVVI